MIRSLLLETVEYCIDAGTPYVLLSAMCLVMIPLEMLFLTALISALVNEYYGVTMMSVTAICGFVIITGYMSLLASLMQPTRSPLAGAEHP